MGREMALLANSVGFSEPGGDFVIDLVHALEAKGVEMISRGESFDAAKAGVLQASPRTTWPSIQFCRTTNAAKLMRTWKAIRVFSGRTISGPFRFAIDNNLSKMARTLFGFSAKWDARV